MPIFYTPPIIHPPVIQTAIVHQVNIGQVEAVEKRIIREVLLSKDGYVLVKVGTYTLDDIQTHYNIPKEAIGQIMLDVGKIGIATRLVMSETVPTINEGLIYLMATNNDKHPAMKQTKIKEF